MGLLESIRKWIDGEQVGGSKGTYPIINPATEELVGLAPEGSADANRFERNTTPSSPDQGSL